MINIFQHPTEKSPVLGVTFYSYEDMDIKWDYQKFESVPHALGYLQSMKHTLLALNMEAFRFACQEVFPAGNSQISHIVYDAIRIVHATTVLVIDNAKERWQFCLENVLENANFMRILIKHAPADKKPSLILMAAGIMEFTKTELECQQKKV